MTSLLRTRLTRTATFVFRVALLTIATGSLAYAQFQPYGESQSEFAPPPVSTGQLVLTRLLPILLAALIGFAIGAFFSPALRHIRRYLTWALAAAVFIYALFGRMTVAEYTSYAVAVVVFFIALNIGISLGARALAKLRRPTSLGSAQWADLDHLRANGIIGRDGFVLGEFVTGSRNVYPLQYKGERHLLTVAPTRSGKGVSSIIPEPSDLSGFGVRHRSEGRERPHYRASARVRLNCRKHSRHGAERRSCSTPGISRSPNSA